MSTAETTASPSTTTTTSLFEPESTTTTASRTITSSTTATSETMTSTNPTTTISAESTMSTSEITTSTATTYDPQASCTITTSSETMTSSTTSNSETASSNTESTTSESASSSTMTTTAESIASSTATTSETITTTTVTSSETGSSSITTTTSSAAGPIATFYIIANGGSANGARLSGDCIPGGLLIFNPITTEVHPISFSVEEGTGHVLTDTGYVCAYYGDSPFPYNPARLAICLNGDTGPDKEFDYITCQGSESEITCTTPVGTCVDDFGDLDGPPTTICAHPGGTLNRFFTMYSSNGEDYVYMASDSPSGYHEIGLGIESV
ncbi:hypothetical protein FALBO_6036 [Fusarium albosuccineum]|uniref:Uncharacterized protein n=1 Tax=Fusarium albosuccineum TaxID=1237068 RepID=A0A8H4PC49_9HYPO|nr:hypothetical protein FALBO_6036 [Fusarium albosuccineum]